MATDKLTVPFECPACHETVGIPTASRYEYGHQVVAVDSGPLHDHIRERHRGGDHDAEGHPATRPDA